MLCAIVGLKKAYRAETSKDNHFMYWHNKNFRNPDGSK